MRREEIYLTNIVKCHPPNNRDPRQEEQESCIPYLKYETLLLRPKMIVCLGRIAAQRIIRSDYRIYKRTRNFSGAERSVADRSISSFGST